MALTDPCFHDGAVSSLKEAVRLMGELQLGQDLDSKTVNRIVAFLKTLNKKESRNFAKE